MRRWLSILFVMLACGVSLSLQAADVGRIKVSGAIGPATASYIARAIETAGARSNVCLIVQLDTPGGSLDATREIIQKFYASSVPIVVYVAPAGAWAGSAGCFITLASDVAAMAPSTSIGAAHPVSIGMGGQQQQDEVMKKKLENFAGSYIASIAEKRGRNIEWAMASVTNSESITDTKAQELHVIDLIAADTPELLKQLNGREVNGKPLHTSGANVVDIAMTGGEQTLQFLSHPEMMLILMLVAIYGIIGELSNPGAVLPGVVGAIALILVLYMAAVLPVSIAGLVMVGLAVVLFIIDLYAPTHGVLTFGGIISFFIGTIMLFNRAGPAYHLSLAYIIPATVLTAAFFIFVVGAGVRAQFLPVRAGKEEMIGKTVTALTPINASGGKVFLEGEYWNAVSAVPIAQGQVAEVVGIDGLTLQLKPKST